MCHTNPRFIKEIEDRIRDSLIKETIGEVTGHSIDLAMKEIEDMDVVEVSIGEVIFVQEVTFKVDIIIVEWTEIGKIGGHGDNPGSRERDRDRRSQSPSSSRSRSRTSTNRDRIRCFKCREYDHFANECPNLFPDSSDREKDSARSVSLHLADSDTGSDTERYLNI